VALVKAFTSNPRTGWIRGSSALGPEVTAEISRLSAENASLRAQLSRVIGESERDNERALDDLLITLRGNKQEYFVRVAGKTGWQESENHNMLTIFRIFAPNMIVDSTTEHLGHLLAINSVREEADGTTPRAEIVPTNEVADILADFMALGLMTPSGRKHPVSDKGIYWSLTARGNELISRVNAKRLAEISIKSEPEDSAIVTESDAGEAAASSTDDDARDALGLG